MEEVLILKEPAYSGSIWCGNLTSGLVGELKQKRITYKIIDSLNEIKAFHKYSFIIGSDNEWVRSVLTECGEMGIYPILLCNQISRKFDVNYSTVCSDIAGSMKHLVEILESAGKERIALYGVNPQSVSDEGRKDSFLAARGLTEERDIYQNGSSLENCFDSFLPRAEEYDVVICTNDFAAISLVRHLEKRRQDILDKILIIGCAEARLTESYAKRILSVRLNFEEYGRAAVAILNNVKRNPFISSIVIMIKWDCPTLQDISPKQEGRMNSRKEYVSAEGTDTFYSDSELWEMMLVECLLCQCKDVDDQIIKKIMEGQSYETIAEQCFLTESSIKYRVKRMEKICRVKGRRQLSALLCRYLQRDSQP